MKADVASCLLELQREESAARARFLFAEDLEVFQGHFPGSPLVPAVFLVEAVRLASEGWAERPLRLELISKAKFTGEVRPGAEVGVDVAMIGEAPAWTCKARLRSGERDVASLTLRLREES